MKTPEEYVKEWSGSSMFPSRELCSIIKQAQTEAYNQAIDDAANNADIAIKKKSHHGKYRKWQKVKEEDVDLFDHEVMYSVDKQSILKLKKV